MERERIASRRHTEVTPADKRKHLTLKNGFSTPAPPFFGGTLRDTRAAAKCQETAEPVIASPDAFGIVAHGVKPASDCAATVLEGLALLAPGAGMPAVRAMA